MTTLAKLVVKLIADVSEFSSGMDTAAKKAAAIGQKLQGIGDKMTVGVTLPLLAAGTAATKFASDLEETRNKTRVVFGRMGEDMLKFGAQASRTMGMSENSALSYAATYGSILTNMGIAEEEAAKISKALTQLTADYASFHNLSPGEAFEKIKAGLVGSSEPLLALGKDLRVASVQAFALQSGIAKAGEQMTPAQLAMARFGALIAQSSKEMGDFARTSDGLANSTRTLKASVEDVMASFGEVLIPTVTEFMQALIPILRWFNDLPKPIKTGIVYFLMFVAALGPVMSTAGRLMQLFGAISGGLAGKAGIAAGAAKAAGALGGAVNALGGLAAGIGAVLGPVLALAAAVAALILVIKTMGPQALESARMLAVIVGKMLTDAYYSVLKFRLWMMDAGQRLVEGFIVGVLSMAQRLIEAVVKPVRTAVEYVRKLLKISSPSGLMRHIGEMAIEGFAVGIEAKQEQPLRAMQSVPLLNTAGIGGGSRSVQIGEIRVFGDLSDSQLLRMKEEMRRIAETVFGDALR
ncbi:MAG: hypothetical protein KatS3mg054_0662 [Chloroflexus sp.]|nr:MAG: hypothetical protein KatS3mg054_0662 [Chloroflexus sp.]